RGGDTLDQLILTDAGDRLVTISATDQPGVVNASVDMGAVVDIAEPDDWHAIGTDPMRPVRHLSLGNPHAVVGVDEVGVVDLLTLGQLVPYVNLEIVEPGPEPHAITMRVHERGAGITERVARAPVLVRGRPARGASFRRRSKKSWCTWTAVMRRYVCTIRCRDASP
ncbi:MAG TPA: hypothetical protein PLP26_03840, partial [Ilumatobacteraceae bacterium]|nr:hypothetical protein [Ilumatobacteraceae bacterium]